jgi:hypothetical protein
MTDAPVYLSAGMSRSGSTWLYNALRLILAEKHPRLYARWVENSSGAEAVAAAADAVLIKTHDPTRFWSARATMCFTCHRDLRDIAVSLRDMGWADDRREMLDWVDRIRRNHDFWAPRAVRDFAYDEILGRPVELLAEMAKLCSVELSTEQCAAISAALSRLDGDRNSTAIHDPTTLMHPRHRFDGRANRFLDGLGAEAAAEIALRHGDWLTRMGYDPALAGGTRP